MYQKIFKKDDFSLNKTDLKLFFKKKFLETFLLLEIREILLRPYKNMFRKNCFKLLIYIFN